jgi:hypothetical protein
MTVQVVQYVESFLGENLVAMHTMLINKPPDAGNIFLPVLLLL